MKNLSVIILICLLTITKHAFAQEDNYFLQTHVNGENGLPQNSVRDMVFSSSGYMWIATENGLVRFDGMTPKTYNTQNSALKKDRVSQLIKTGDGKLYCLTEDYMLYEIIETAPAVSLRFLSEIPNKVFNLYHSFLAYTIVDFLNICKTSVPENYEKSDRFAFYIFKGGNLIAQRSNEGLLIFSRDLQLKKKILIPNLYQADFFVYNGLLYMRDPKGYLFLIDDETGKLIAQKVQQGSAVNYRLDKAAVTDKLYWNEKTGDAFWISGKQLYNITVKQNRVVLEKLFFNLPDYAVTRIMYTQKRQNIIIGTASDGFYVYHKKQFSIISSPYTDNIYYAQAPVNNHHTVLTQNMQELGQGYQKSITQLGEYDRTTLCTDAKSNIWFSSNGDLKCFNPFSNTVKTTIHIPDADSYGVFVIANNDSSSLLVASWRSLFYYKIDGGLKKLIDFNSAKHQKKPICILKEADSVIWTGTYDGLYKYNTLSGRTEHDKLNGLIVRSLFKTSSGLLLAGTYGDGIYAITQNKATPLPLDKNNHLETAHGFMEDKSGFIWISSNSGLFKVALREIDDYVAGPQTSQIYYHRFSNVDGLPTNEFNGGCFPCAIAVNRSTWSFSSMKGLVWFQPDSIKTGSCNADVYIDKILLNDTEVAVPDVQTIFTQTHRFKLSIYTSSPNWSDENNLLVEYRLAGDDSTSKWILQKDNTAPIVLQNLPGGNHQLIIRKRGIKGDNLKEINLTINVPLLLSEYVWFWPVSIITALLFIWAIVKAVTYSIRKRKEKLKRLVTEKTIALKETVDILELQNIQIKQSEASLKKESELKSSLLFLLSHDIASPLRFINMFLSGFTHQTKPAPITHNDLVDLKISTNNLENLLDNIVTWMKSTHEKMIEPVMMPVNLHQLVQGKIALFELAAKKKENSVRNTIPGGTIFYSDQFIIAMALQNLLGNAINYTRNGSIEIGYAETGGEHKITVTDSGIGMNSEMVEVMTKGDYAQMSNESGHLLQGYGIGLKITSELLRLINGSLSLMPVKDGNGTMAVLYIKRMQPLQ